MINIRKIVYNKKVTRDKEGHFKITKCSIHHKHNIVSATYASNKRAQNYIKQNNRNKERCYNAAMIPGDFTLYF